MSFPPEGVGPLPSSHPLLCSCRYTYGKPVIGSVKADFCRNAFSFYWYSGEQPKDICRTFQLMVRSPGPELPEPLLPSANFPPDLPDGQKRLRVADRERERVRPQQAHVRGPLRGWRRAGGVRHRWVRVGVGVREAPAGPELCSLGGSGVVLKGVGQTSFSSQVRTVTFEDVPASYKPGIPFQGKVKMVGPDSKPVPDEPVYVFVGDSLNLTLTTDAKGAAAFAFDTAPWSGTVTLRVGRRFTNRPVAPHVLHVLSVCRQARSRKTEEREPYEPNLRRPEYRSASHHAAAFYSKSRSFLKVAQGNGKLPCGEEASVRVQYIIQGEELRKGQEVLDHFYLVRPWNGHSGCLVQSKLILLCLQVMSKGRIVQHGRVPVAVKTGSGKKKKRLDDDDSGI